MEQEILSQIERLNSQKESLEIKLDSIKKDLEKSEKQLNDTKEGIRNKEKERLFVKKQDLVHIKEYKELLKTISILKKYDENNIAYKNNLTSQKNNVIITIKHIEETLVSLDKAFRKITHNILEF